MIRKLSKSSQALARRNLKKKSFPKWKASSLRSSWLARCKKLDIDPGTVPNTHDIEAWLMEQVPYTCYYSDEPLGTKFEVDHKWPLSRGGDAFLDNVCICSPAMNGAKGNLTDIEFKQLLKLVSKWEDKGKSLLIRLRRGHF